MSKDRPYWMLYGVSEYTRQTITGYAKDNDLTIAEALEAITRVAFLAIDSIEASKQARELAESQSHTD
jgi:hypothetical protein